MSNPSIKAKIEAITPLTDSILQLILSPKLYIDYIAGQYLQILSKKDALSYSIANAPLGSHKYELHIRHTPHNPYYQPLLNHIKQQGAVTICVPMGHCHINRLHADKPIIFIAGGTGFAPIKAMIEQLLTRDQSYCFELFWSARTKSDLYMDEKASYWGSHVQNFKYFTQLSESNKDNIASMIIKQHPHDIHEWQMVISGPFDMAYSAREQLIAHGALPENLFSDAFDFKQGA